MQPCHWPFVNAIISTKFVSQIFLVFFLRHRFTTVDWWCFLFAPIFWEIWPAFSWLSLSLSFIFKSKKAKEVKTPIARRFFNCCWGKQRDFVSVSDPFTSVNLFNLTSRQIYCNYYWGKSHNSYLIRQDTERFLIRWGSAFSTVYTHYKITLIVATGHSL